jgi:serine/threonine-protein kinase
MARCPSCSVEAPEGSRFCPGCGGPLSEDGGTTRTSLPATGMRAAPPTPTTVSQPGEARFLPGSVVAGRYRVVGLLGRGGMGEVYRADDLKLGQAVALKFLPREVERDERRLQRFLNEVRLALRITHPNVCRVHDIGEVEGQHFISMEYVDGEDLASLLRRIGRLPQERAVEIARQLCAGLAAAHEAGILHRDLKPANIMIDGRGRARITDFGLADLSGTVVGEDVRAGTPSYMAPEQLSGSGVTERSDIYALGLVLYEMFTGKAAFNARSAAEMAQLQQSTVPTEPTTLVKGLDPAVERVLLRALDTDPARRPASALAVAAALPGGDPLAAALAAGETPSPEMVAAAGEKGGMAPAWVAVSLLLILAGMLAVGLVRPKADALGLIETPYSITALHERSRVMAERLGFEETPADTAHGITTDGDYVEWLRDDEQVAEMRARIEAGRPPVYLFWYRQSPERLTPVDSLAEQASINDPPLTIPGMLLLQLDPQGRLVRLEAVPADQDGQPQAQAGPVAASPADEGEAPPVSAEAAAADLGALWSSLFDQAGLDPARFRPVQRSYRPPFFADVRAAWEGTLEEARETTLRVEAAALDGRLVSFRIVGPWTRDRGTPEEQDALDSILPFVYLTISLSVLTGLAVLARRNLHRGRSDLKGATRIGLFILGVQLISLLLGFVSVFGRDSTPDRVFPLLAFVVFLGLIVFLAYVALEPYARRLWPTVLIAWTRMLSGRLRDPLVGRDLLIGAVCGVATSFLEAGHILLPPILGLPEEPLATGAARFAIGPLEALSDFFNMVGGSVGLPMMMMVSLVLIRLLLRNTTATVVVFFVFAVALSSLGSTQLVLDVALHVIVMGLTLFVVLRIGLVAAFTLWLFDWGCGAIRTLDPSSWTGPAALVIALMLLAVAACAAVIALGDRTLLQDEV